MISRHTSCRLSAVYTGFSWICPRKTLSDLLYHKRKERKGRGGMFHDRRRKNPASGI